MSRFGKGLSIVASLICVLTTGCELNPTDASPVSASAPVTPPDTSGAFARSTGPGLTEGDQQALLTFTIETAKTKCGKDGGGTGGGEEGEEESDGRDYIKIGGQIVGLDPSEPLIVAVSGVPPIFGLGPLASPVTIPAGTKGPFPLNAGTIKVSLPKSGTGNFHINVDGVGLNDCSGLEMTADLILTLNGVSQSITLRRKTESKFGL